jgi:hypothetical protein
MTPGQQLELENAVDMKFFFVKATEPQSVIDMDNYSNNTVFYTTVYIPIQGVRLWSGMDSPDARLIQASVGVHPLVGGCGTKRPP